VHPHLRRWLGGRCQAPSARHDRDPSDHP